MKDQLLSVILLVEPGSDAAEYVRQAVAVLPRECEQYQIVVVQDGGGVAGKVDLQKLFAAAEGVRYICLAQSSGLDKALSAGLEAAIGDFCLTLVPAKDPFALIPEFFARCQQDGGLVIGQRLHPNREGGWVFQIGKRILHFFVYTIMGSDFPKDTTFMVCLDRHSLNVINQAHDRERFLRAITSRVGLPVQTVPYQLTGDGAKLRSFWQSLNLSLDVLFMNSVQPLRLATYLAVALAIGNGAYGLFALGFGGVTVVQVSFGLSALFAILAVLSEYLKRVLHEVRDRPGYVVAQDVSSANRVHNLDRPNLTSLK